MSFSYSVNAKVGKHDKTKSFQFQDKVHRYASEDSVLFRFGTIWDKFGTMSISYSVNAKVGKHDKTKSFQFQDRVHRYASEDNVLFRFQKCEGMKIRLQSTIKTESSSASKKGTQICICKRIAKREHMVSDVVIKVESLNVQTSSEFWYVHKYGRFGKSII